MQILAAVVVRLKVAGALVFERRLVGWAKVGRPSKKPRDVLGEHIEHFARGVSARNAFRVGWEDWKTGVPLGRHLAALHLLNFCGELRMRAAIRGEQIGPAAALDITALPD